MLFCVGKTYQFRNQGEFIRHIIVAVYKIKFGTVPSPEVIKLTLPSDSAYLVLLMSTVLIHILSSTIPQRSLKTLSTELPAGKLRY